MSGKSFHPWLGMVALFFALRGVGAEPVLTLEEAIQTALTSNRPLRLLELNLDSREMGVAEARTEFSIQLRPEGQVATDNEGTQTAYGLSASKKQGVGTKVQVEGRWTQTGFSESPDLHRGIVRVEVRQPLLRRLGRLVNEEPIVQARSSVQAARREIELRRTDLVVQVVEGYEGLLRLQRQLQFDTQALQRSEQLLRLTQARERQGRATRVDALRVDLQHGENQIRLNKTRENLENARAEFAELLGRDPGVELTVTESPLLEVEAPDRDEAVRVALSNRLDYAQVLADSRDVERGVRIARHNLLPDLELIGRYERSGEGARASEGFDLDRDTWFVGLSAGEDVRRQRERLALGEALLRGESARQTMEMVRVAVERQIQQVLAAYERARGDTLFAQRNYHLAESRARLARRMFEIGKGDNFTVTDAENALLEAQNRMLLSQAEVSIAAYRLLRALGTLVAYPDDLKPPAGGEMEGRCP